MCIHLFWRNWIFRASSITFIAITIFEWRTIGLEISQFLNNAQTAMRESGWLPLKELKKCLNYFVKLNEKENFPENLQYLWILTYYHWRPIKSSICHLSQSESIYFVQTNHLKFPFRIRINYRIYKCSLFSYQFFKRLDIKILYILLSATNIFSTLHKELISI